MGLTRTAFLRQKLDDTQLRLSDLELLVDALKGGSDAESTMLLAKIRVGHDVNEIIEALKDCKSESSSSVHAIDETLVDFSPTDEVCDQTVHLQLHEAADG